jgi:endonuclease/exonuclease/phosphatase family metal-dependent hydrolase
VARLRIVTWNVLGAESRREQRAALAAQLRALQPDVVCLQEARRPLARRVARAWLASPTRTFVAKRGDRRLWCWQEGIATLGAGPVAAREWIDLRAGRRVAVVTDHGIGDLLVRVYNAHLDTETECRATNVAVLLERLEGDRRRDVVPIVAGDLNTKPRRSSHTDQAYARLVATGLVDAVALGSPDAADHERCPGRVQTDPGAEEAARCCYTTWHDARLPGQRTGNPHQRLDYVLVADDPRVRVVRAWSPVPTDDDFDAFRVVSDHLPVIADLEIGAGS